MLLQKLAAKLLLILEAISFLFIGLIAILVLIMGIFGIYALWSNAHNLTPAKYDVNLIWSGIGYLTGAGVLALAPKLSEFAKTLQYYIQSKYNSPEGKEPVDIKTLTDFTTLPNNQQTSIVINATQKVGDSSGAKA